MKPQGDFWGGGGYASLLERQEFARARARMFQMVDVAESTSSPSRPIRPCFPADVLFLSVFLNGPIGELPEEGFIDIFGLVLFVRTCVVARTIRQTPRGTMIPSAWSNSELSSHRTNGKSRDDLRADAPAYSVFKLGCNGTLSIVQSAAEADFKAMNDPSVSFGGSVFVVFFHTFVS